jgi:hypothetical protein
VQSATTVGDAHRPAFRRGGASFSPILIALAAAVLLLAALAALPTPAGAAPTNTINGAVTDGQGNPIAGATVDLYKPVAAPPLPFPDFFAWELVATKTADADGKFEFTPLDDGKYVLIFEDTYLLGGGTEMPGDLESGDGLVTVSGGQTVDSSYAVPDFSVLEGAVLDDWGLPVASAAVTLAREDRITGLFVDLPSDSHVFSEENRTNPLTSDADGRFHWELGDGSFKVTTDKDARGPVAHEAAHVVQQQRRVVLKLGGGTEPELPGDIVGEPTPGSTLTATLPAGLTDDFSASDHQWRRDGVPIPAATAATYLVSAADAGHALSVVSTIQREKEVVDSSDPSILVGFDPFEARSGELGVKAEGTGGPPPKAGDGTKADDGAPSIGRMPRSADNGKPLRLRVVCPLGCRLVLKLWIGKHRVKGLKDVKLKPGTTKHTLRLPRRIVRMVERALAASGKGPRVTLRLTPRHGDTQGRAREVSLK